MPGLSHLRGVLPALVTPFDPDTLAPDIAALTRLIERSIERGVAGLVICGTTGEAPALRPAEQARILFAAVEAAAGRVPVIAGVGAPCTETAVELAEAAQHCGVDALLVSAPPYVRPGQAALRAHVRAVAAGGHLPVMLYDVPSRAGVAFADDTVAQLHDEGLIHAIKDATADLARPARLRRLCGDMPQFTGDDATAVAHLAMGGAGSVSVTANVAPALCVATQATWDAAEHETLAGLRDLLAPLHEALFTEVNPVPVKAALRLLRLCPPTHRLPLLPATPATLERLAAVLAEVMPEEETRARAALWRQRVAMSPPALRRRNVA